MSERIINANASEFNELIKGGKVVVDFWAPRCGPCLALAPVLEELVTKEANVTVVKINVDVNAELSEKLGIRNIPTLFFYSNGELKEKKVGLLSLDQIIETLAKF